MISVIIPFHNEKENLPILYDQLFQALPKLGEDFEVIFIDDGSLDHSSEALVEKMSDDRFQLIRHGKQLGKGRGLNTGIKKAQGDIMVFMDSDLQDDPEDLAQFYAKIQEGYDFVNGIRAKRKDNPVVKMYSKLASVFLRTFLKSPFTDINCGFKMFKRSVLQDFVLYANNFRFLPLATYYHGFRVTEIPVNNKPRIHGVSKFGSKKLIVGIFDTLTAYFLYQFSERPLHFFGSIGGIFFLTGFITAFVLSIQRIFFGMLLYRRPSLLLAVLLMIVGIQIFMTGIIGELIVYVNKKKKS